MSASGSVSFGTNVLVTEVVPAGDGSSTANIIHALNQFTGLTISKNFTGASTPPYTTAWTDTVDLVAGAATIDLTALARQSPLEDINMDTLEIITWCFAGAAANSNEIEVAPGASNGYPICGTADDKITVYPNMIYQCSSITQKDFASVAAGSADEIDFAGTGTEQIHVLLIAG